MILPLREFIRFGYKVEQNTIAHSLRHAKSCLNFDFDVYLPSFGIYLQRPFIWTLEQQQSLIESVIFRDTRAIPPVAVVSRDDISYGKYEVIDGKQRLMTLLNFSCDGFPIHLFGKDYLLSELPEDYRNWILGYPIIAWLAYDLTDRQKVDWFTRINFAGTPQDRHHMEHLQAVLTTEEQCGN